MTEKKKRIWIFFFHFVKIKFKIEFCKESRKFNSLTVEKIRNPPLVAGRI